MDKWVNMQLNMAENNITLMFFRLSLLNIVYLRCVVLPLKWTFCQGALKVYFRLGETSINESYKGNGALLSKFAEDVNSYQSETSARIGIISIISSTLPREERAQTTASQNSARSQSPSG